MSVPKRWILAAPHEAAADLAKRLNVSPLVGQMLLNRGFSELDDCHKFLAPKLTLLHDPNGLPGLPAAAKRIAEAIEQKQKIVIYGDYDVDGITATSILWHAIRTLGGSAEHYIPHRIDEGYGLNAEAIAQLCDAGNQLIITVDCGVTAVEPAKIAKQRGVDLIITDHHEFHADALPEATAIVHPKLPGSEYLNSYLCGAGVAFKLAWGVGQTMAGGPRVSDAFKQFLVEATALAALGTIADVVPLVGENRVLAHFGLNGLRCSKLAGVQALIKSAGLDGQQLDGYHAGFLLAPRLNACGRMGHAGLAVKMLTDASPHEALEIAQYLEQQNRSRQAVERQMVAEAMEQVAEHKLNEHHIIIVGHTGWHPGVVGIVASRLVDKFCRPAFVIGLNEGIGAGSGRSVPGVHLTHLLEAVADKLETFGGHEMAAGLKLKAENFAAFRDALTAHADKVIDPENLCAELKLDVEAGLDHMSEALVGQIKRLGPFGNGNRKPILVLRDLELAGPPRRVGRTGDHLQLFVRQGNQHMKAIAFNAAEMFDQLQTGTKINLAVEPSINEFNGRTSVELTVKDLQIAS